MFFGWLIPGFSDLLMRWFSNVGLVIGDVVIWCFDDSVVQRFGASSIWRFCDSVVRFNEVR